jgi:hypothetical protein
MDYRAAPVRPTACREPQLLAGVVRQVARTVRRPACPFKALSPQPASGFFILYWPKPSRWRGRREVAESRLPTAIAGPAE